MRTLDALRITLALDSVKRKLSRFTSDYEKDPNPENWRTISGSHVHLNEYGEIDGGAGGKFNKEQWNGKTKHGTEKVARIGERIDRLDVPMHVRENIKDLINDYHEFKNSPNEWYYPKEIDEFKDEIIGEIQRQTETLNDKEREEVESFINELKDDAFRYHRQGGMNSLFGKETPKKGNAGKFTGKIATIKAGDLPVSKFKVPKMNWAFGIPSNVMSEEVFLRKNGLDDPMIFEWNSIGPGNMRKASPKQREKLMKELHKKQDEYTAKRNEAIEEYQRLVKAGKIRDFTSLEKSLLTANGHPDLRATQAARRMCAKRGIDWHTGKPLNEQTAKGKETKTKPKGPPAERAVSSISEGVGFDLSKYRTHILEKRGQANIEIKKMSWNERKKLYDYALKHKDFSIWDVGGVGVSIVPRKSKPSRYDNPPYRDNPSLLAKTLKLDEHKIHDPAKGVNSYWHEHEGDYEDIPF